MNDHVFVSLEFSSAKRTINPLPRYPDPTIVHSFVLTVYILLFSTVLTFKWSLKQAIPVKRAMIELFS